MSTSEIQFQQLLERFALRADASLAETRYLLPMGLALTSAGALEVIEAPVDCSDRVADHVDFIERALRARAATGTLLATCVAYPEHARKVVIAMLENSEGFCSRVTIPVAIDAPSTGQTKAQPMGPNPGQVRLDMDALTVQESSLFIFPDPDGPAPA